MQWKMTINLRCWEVFFNKMTIQQRKCSLIHYRAFFGSEGHVALDRNPGLGYDTLLLRLIPGDILSASPHRQFHTLPSLLENCQITTLMHCVSCREAVCTIFWWFLVWPGRDANLRPTVWEADTLTTKPTRHGASVVIIHMYQFWK